MPKRLRILSLAHLLGRRCLPNCCPARVATRDDTVRPLEPGLVRLKRMIIHNRSSAEPDTLQSRRYPEWNCPEMGLHRSHLADSQGRADQTSVPISATVPTVSYECARHWP